MTGDAALDAAYAHCLDSAASHYENFPVASVLVPAEVRPHIAAVYAFARAADDFADEPGYSTRERLRLLDEWLERLHAALGAVPPADLEPGGGAHVATAPDPASADRIFLSRPGAHHPLAGVAGGALRGAPLGVSSGRDGHAL